MERAGKKDYKVLVLDMQPIDPPIGGGRIRLLGLYHDLGPYMSTTYIGTYDWPGPDYRKHSLSPTLKEIDVPLSQKHFSVNRKWMSHISSKTIIDTTFPLLGRLSEHYVKTVKDHMYDADIVCFSHPWVYPLVRDDLDDARQLIVYDSQNVEGLLRTELLDDERFGTEIVKTVICSEYELSHRSDVILTCSKQDMNDFEHFYGISQSKMIEIPNGVFTRNIIPPSAKEKKAAKKRFQIQGMAAIFLGSNYQPNNEAMDFIVKKMAPRHKNLEFIICGGVSDSPEAENLKKQGSRNVRFTGLISEEEKKIYLWASDIAVNPMSSGSGTNIKMFDFMSAALPVVATPVGARGIECGKLEAIKVVVLEEFSNAIKEIINTPELARRMGENSRKVAEEKYAFESISKNLGSQLKALYSEKTFRNRKAKAPHSCSANIERPNKSCSPATNKSPPKIPLNSRLSILTTWGLKCGVAEYSRYLANAMAQEGITCHILADKNLEGKISGKTGWIAENIHVKNIWDYLLEAELDIDSVIKTVVETETRKLNIQYHPVFFEEINLIILASACKRRSIDVSVTLHNIRDMNWNTLEKLDSLGVKLFNHKKDDVKELSSKGLLNAVHIPHGILTISTEKAKVIWEKRNDYPKTPVIGTFGFLRPHKGLKELINAIDMLRDLFPRISLIAMCSVYPSDDSQSYFIECQKETNDLKLAEHVEIHTEFLEIHKVIEWLQLCDVIVLPYKSSNEGASGSVNIALAAKRPVITTKIDIFKDLRQITYQMEHNHYSSLALGIANVLTSPYLMESLRSNVDSYVQRNSWQNIARKYITEIYG